MDQKEKIILAAAEEFSLQSFRMTTMRTISKRAGVNHAMINYYFSSKEELYKQVILYLIEKTPIVAEEDTPIRDKKEWETAIRRWILAFVQSVNSPERFYDWKNKIFFREMVDSSNIFAEIYDDYIKPHLQAIISYINMGTDDDDTLYMLLFSVISNSVFYTQNRNFVQTIKGTGYMDEKKYEKLAEYISECVLMRLEFKQ